MIELIEETRVVARCGICKEVRDVELDTLLVKTVDATTAVVALAQCPCGAVEFLVRTTRPEHPAPGSESHRHQLLVDHLAAELAGRKQVASGSRNAEQVCAPVATDVLERWFPDGLNLAAVADDVKP